MMTKALLLLLSALVIAQAAPNTRSCHGSDYLQCAFVIAGCTASCGGASVRLQLNISEFPHNCFQDWMTCMINCVINNHHEQCIDCISKDFEPELAEGEAIVETEVVAETEPEHKSCHGTDYLKCGFVIAGCASKCSNSHVRTKTIFRMIT